MVGSAFVFGVSLLLLGLVTTIWQYYLVVALGFGLTVPNLVGVSPRAAIANWFIRKRSMATTFFSLGSSAAGIFIAPLVAWTANTFNWQTSWVLLGFTAWVVIPVAWFSIRRRPEDIGLLPDGDIPAANSPMSTEAVKINEIQWTVPEALRTSSYWLVIAGFMLMGLGFSSLFIHMAPYVISKGFSANIGVATLTIYATSGIVGRFAWGSFIDRFTIHKSLVALGIFYGISIAIFTIPESLTGIYTGAIMLGLGVGGVHQLLGQTLPAYFGRNIAGSLLGYSAPFNTIAGAAAPLFAAIMYDITNSYTLPFSVFSVSSFLSAAIFLMAKPPIHPQQK
jgi:MFS family permease